MATRSTKSKKTRKKRTYTKKATKQEKAQKSLMRDEIILIVTFVISILLILSNFDLSGKVGKVINQVTFGLFGFLGYFMPIIFFTIVVFTIANRGNKIAYGKTFSLIILIATIAGLIQLISSSQPLETLSGYYTISSNSKRGGGIIGGALVNLIHPLFGTAGSYVIIIGLILICLLLLTGKALLVQLGTKSRKKFNAYKVAKGKKGSNKSKSSKSSKSPEPSTNRKSSVPRTFLLKDKFKNITSKNKAKQEEQVFDVKEIQVNDVKDANDSDDVTDKKDISVKDIDIPIHRAENNNEDFIEEDMTEDNINQEENKKENKKSNVKKKIIHNNKANKISSGQTKTGDIEELKLDQSIDEEKEYVFPSLNLLSKPKRQTKVVSDQSLKQTAIKLQETLESFGVGATVTNVSCGPTVTRYELQPEQGVKVSKITALSDDIKLNLATSDIRIEAPIPGKAAVGIEVPNKENSIVTLREMLESKDFKEYPSKLAFAVGKDIGGRNIIGDIGKMPHLLIAGATGSGKSVCINSIIMSILYNAKPSEVRLIMIDPKVVELSVYNGIPHLLLPVVTDPKKAASALNWGVNEMTDRYKKFADLGVRDLESYNEKVTKDPSVDEEYKKLAQIVIIVDELADLMMVASKEVEDAIARLAQMARAAGIYLIIATQRPSVNVITGVIKANIPSRIAFSVSSSVDSRTILDGSGAEKLLGKGDMLYYPSGYSKPLRVQGSFVSDKEITKAVNFLTENNGQVEYDKEVEKEIISSQSSIPSPSSDYMERDEYFADAGKYIIEKEKASIGMLQRVFRVGFNRAARIMDQLNEAGAVGPEDGTKPRDILMTAEEFEEYLKTNNIV